MDEKKPTGTEDKDSIEESVEVLDLDLSGQLPLDVGAIECTPEPEPPAEPPLPDLPALPEVPIPEPGEQPAGPAENKPKFGPRGRQFGRHSTRAEAEERRRRVYELRLAGLSIPKIAKVFGVHPNTICKDIAVLKDEQTEKLKHVDPTAEIGAHIRFLEKISEEALTSAASADAEKDKAAALTLAMNARKTMMQLQIDTGILPKANPKADVESLMDFEGRDIRQMGVSELEQVVRDLTQRLSLAVAKEKAEQRTKPSHHKRTN